MPQTSHQGIRKNRLHSRCDILLAAIYGMSNEETVALLREKMREATGKPPTQPSETTESAPGEPPEDAETITCLECGATVPAHFDECWKCQRLLQDLPTVGL